MRLGANRFMNVFDGALYRSETDRCEFGARPGLWLAMRRLIHERVTRSVIESFYEVYNGLGFGFLEHVYRSALCYELRLKGHDVAREFGTSVMYKGLEISRQRLDLVVDQKVVIETKAGYELHPGARRQLFNYLRATNLEVGLLLHCGPKPYFERVISTNPESVRTRSGKAGPHSIVS